MSFLNPLGKLSDRMHVLTATDSLLTKCIQNAFVLSLKVLVDSYREPTKYRGNPHAQSKSPKNPC